MTIVETAEGYVYTIPETLPPKPVVASAVVSGNTQLNVTDGDGLHLVLHGDLGVNDKYILCEDTSHDLKFAVDKDGKIRCPDIVTDNFGSVEGGLVSLEGSMTTNFNAILTSAGDITANNALIQTNITHIAGNNAYSVENENDIDAMKLILGSAIGSSTTALAHHLVLRPEHTGDFTQFDRLESEVFRALGTNPNYHLIGQGAFNFVPTDSNNQVVTNCEYAFGKKLDDLGDPSGAGDGIFMKRDDNEIQIEVRKAAPTIRITGEKNADVDYFQILNETDEIVFAIDKGGNVRHGGHLIDTVGELPDTEGHSGVFESTSLYIGPVRLSYDQASGILKQQVLNRIPLALQNVPYSVTNADLSGRGYADLSARQWVVLARNKIDDPSVKARDIFTSAADWDDHNVHHAQNLTSDAQTQFGEIATDITDLETLTTNINADVTTLETEMDSAETRLTTIESDFAPKADPVFTSLLQADQIQIGDLYNRAVETFANTLVVASRTSDAGITISTQENKKGSLIFGGYNDADEHHIVCYHQDTGAYKNGIHIKVGGGDGDEAISVTRQSGANRIGINKLDPDEALDVDGNVNCSGEFQIDGTAFLGNVNNVGSYSTQQADTLLVAKANQSTTYTKAEVDTANGTQDTVIALNTAKVTYDEAPQVATNVTNIALKSNQSTTYTKTEVDTANGNQDTAIALNTSKNTFSTASNTLLHTTHADTLATHATDISNKIHNSGHQTMNGRLTVHHSGNGEVANPHADDLQVYFYNDAGITIGCPLGRIGTLAFSDQNKADRNQLRAYSTVRDSRNIGMHMFANQADTAVPSLSVCSQLIGINNAQPTYALDVVGTVKASTGLVLTKTVQGTALEWASHQLLISTTIDDIRSGSIPIYSSFSMSGVQRFFLEVTSNQITSTSQILVHTWSPDGYETWLPQVSNLRSMYVSGSAGKFRITGAVSGTHDESSNTGTPNLYVNYVIM